MKSFLCAIFVSCVLAVVSAQACVEQEECDETKCCAGIPFMGGICQSFTAEGGKCHLVDRIVPMFGEFYIGPCPCAEGLVCVQQGKKKNDGICQKLVTTTTAPEISADDTGVSADDSAPDASSDDSSADDSAPDASSDDSSADDSAPDASSADDSAPDASSDDASADDSASNASSDDSSASDASSDDSSADASVEDSAAEQPASAPEAE